MEKTNIKKTCPACNSLFECNHSDIKNCFCSSVTISEVDLQKIRSNYNGCLCSTCLTKFSKASGNFVDRLKFLILFFFSFSQAFSQFCGAAGTSNTSAMHKDSSAFIAWASTCVVYRGWQDASNASLGTTDVGLDINGTLKAGDNPVVSLGDGGYAILTFPGSIKNGIGNDFAVFENAFNDAFLELAFVEVSSDGLNFFRFPATSNTQYTTQIGPYDEQGDPTKLNNLAGKYRVNYGTPFDLEEMKNISGLDVNAITHIKISDAVGSIQIPYATYDQNNSKINDPFPTAFGNGGFDLDAVGVMHQNGLGIAEKENNAIVQTFPNPCHEILYIFNPNFENTKSYTLTDIKGTLIDATNCANEKTTLNTRELENGIYFLTINFNAISIHKKIVIQK